MHKSTSDVRRDLRMVHVFHCEQTFDFKHVDARVVGTVVVWAR